MSFFEKNLMGGEQIVYRTRLHPIIFFWQGVLLLYGIIKIAGGLQWGKGVVFLAFVWAISPLVAMITSEFAVTNKRVLVKVGFIWRNSLEILLTKVEGIEVNQSVLGRLLNYGTIIVKGTGGTGTPFKHICDPIALRKSVQEQIEATLQK